MDKLDKIIQEELAQGQATPQLDIDGILNGVHARIKSRAIRRKTVFSIPIVTLLVLMVVAIMPERGTELVDPGAELLMAGWEDSWTVEQELFFDVGSDAALYEQSIDYLIDENYYTYIEDAGELLDDQDLKALIDYLEEV